MFDPKVLYQDRTPPPPKDAPRDQRPTVTRKPRPTARPRKGQGKWFALKPRWAGTPCKACGVELTGERVMAWNSASKATYCLTCFTETYPGILLQNIHTRSKRAKWPKESYGKTKHR